MKRTVFGSVLFLGLAIMGSMGASRLFAQELPRKDLPRVEDILDKEAEAVGGKAAHQKVKTFVMKARIIVDDQEVGLVVHHAGANKQSMQITVEGMGTDEIVVNGESAWLKSSVSGDRMLDGEERAEAFRRAEEFADIFQRVGNWRKQFKQVKVLAEELVEGKAAYKVAVTTQKDASLIDYYDKKTGLLVRREATVDGPDGAENHVQLFSDYRNVDGMTHAFTTRIIGGPVEIVVTIDSMAHNVDIPVERFVIPPDLKKQIAK